MEAQWFQEEVVFKSGMEDRAEWADVQRLGSKSKLEGWKIAIKLHSSGLWQHFPSIPSHSAHAWWRTFLSMRAE